MGSRRWTSGNERTSPTSSLLPDTDTERLSLGNTVGLQVCCLLLIECKMSRAWFVNEISILTFYVNSPKSEEYLCLLTLKLLFFFQSLLIFYQYLFFLTVAYCDQKESTERTILLAFKDSNRAVTCLINHVTVSQIYSNM